MPVVIVVLAVAIVVATVLIERHRKHRLQDIDVDSCLRNLGRLQALEATGLMHAPDRSDLDHLTAEAAQRLRAPVALISFLDDKRSLVASDFGLAQQLSVGREQPVHHTYCKYVVARDEPLSVNDSTRHPLLKKHPATIEQGVRSYLGVPIRTRSGHAIGSFCVVDTQPRQWTADDRRVLASIADRALEDIAV